MADLYTTMIQPALGPIGVVVGAILSYLAVRLTARNSAKAAAEASAVSSRQVDVGEWQAIVSALREEVGRLAGRVERLEQEREESGTRSRALLAYVLELLAWARIVASGATPPPPPSVIADEIP